MNRCILGLILVVIYAFVMLAWVFMDKGFDGMKWLTIWFFASTLFFGFWLGYIYITTPIEELQAEKKGYIWGHIKLGVVLVVVIAMATGLNKKLAILFLNIDGYVTELKEAKVIMRGGVKYKPVGPRSAGGDFSVMDVNNADIEAVPTCDLILKDKCKYGYMKGEKFDIRYVDNLNYPFKYRYLIFEIKSRDYYKGVEYHVGLYKNNQRYVWYLLFFIIIPALIIVFLIPYLIFLNYKVKSN